MSYLLCTLMIYSVGINGLSHETMPIYGRYIQQTASSEVWQVDFEIGFKIAKIDRKLNDSVQWVQHSNCTYLPKGQVPH